MAMNAVVQCTLQYPPEDGVVAVQIPKSVTLSAFTEKVDSTYVLDIGTGIELGLGSVESPKGLYISTSEDITVYLNGATTGFTLVADGYMVIAGGPTEIISITVDVTVASTVVRVWAVE